VTLVTGSHSHGQGHETSFAQLVADTMNVPMEQVRGALAPLGIQHLDQPFTAERVWRAIQAAST
jgi:CO/xanthine dehydrogenase Mo-binding subunit